MQDRLPCKKVFGEKELRDLYKLRDTIGKILESFNLTVIPDEEARKPVPWLVVGEEVFAGDPSTRKGLTVLDAFFFSGP